MGKSKERLVRKFLELPYGIPSQYTYPYELVPAAEKLYRHGKRIVFGAPSVWNYGLAGTDSAIITETVAQPTTVEDGPTPWSSATTPVKLKVKGCCVANWGRSSKDGLNAGPVPHTLRENSPLERITLIPYGSSRLRITIFPRAAPVTIKTR